MSVILSLDIGTGSLKAGLLDTGTGQWLAVASQPITTRHHEDCAEQDANEYWAASLAAVDDLRAKVTSRFRDLKAVSITGQMRSFVLVTHDSQPIGPVLTLYDRRAAEEYREFISEFGLETIHKATGQRFDRASTPAKLRWLRRHMPADLDSAWKILAPKDYLRLRLTGHAATEPIDASGWLLYDPENSAWHPALVEFSGVKPSQLPQIVPACTIAGTLLTELADTWGVSRDVVVAVGGGDDIAATGSGVTEIGDIYEHIGSTGSIFALTDRPVRDPEMVLECYPTETTGLYWVGGSCNSAGIAIDHVLRSSSFCSAGTIDWGEVAAALTHWDAKPPRDRPLFLPFVAGERCPIWNADVRSGWTRGQLPSSPVDWALAAYEGPVYVLAWILQEVGRVIGPTSRVFSAGRAGENKSFAELRATIYGRAIHRIDQPDAALFAAALIAAVTIGEGASVPELVRRWAKPAWTAEPKTERVPLYAERLRAFQHATRGFIASLNASGGPAGSS